MSKLIFSRPVFACTEIENTAKYYQEVLGFNIIKNRLDIKEPHISVYRDDAGIILIKTNSEIKSNKKLHGYGYDAYFVVENIEELLNEFKNSGANIAVELNITDYQHKEFVVEDINGLYLGFGEFIE